VQNAQKNKNQRNSSFWVRNHRFFQKKVTKSELRGGAEFGAHVLMKKLYNQVVIRHDLYGF
jgi:hypothetical protein